MKRKNIFTAIALALSLSLGMVSCISDDSMEATRELPTLTIQNSNGSEMPEYNLYLGNDCVIDPQVSYSGDAANLQYKWQVGTYINGAKGKLEEVSTEPTLNYQFTSGGTYYVHLAVTDGQVGKVIEYKVNVNRTFEKGYLITSTDADGKGNLSFVKTLTSEEVAAGQKEIVIEHCLNKMNPDVSEDHLVNAVLASITWPKSLTRVMVSTDDHCYVIDPNNFTVITAINYGETSSTFRASSFTPDSYAPYAYDKTTGEFVHVNVQYMFSYSKDTFKGLRADAFIPSKMSMWGSVSTNTYLVDYNTNVAKAQNMNTGEFDAVGNLPEGQELLTVFCNYGYDANYNLPVYTFSKDKSTGEVYIWEFIAGNSYYGTPDKFQSQKIDADANTAVPAKGTPFVVSFNQKRYFYALGNRVYVYLPDVATKSLPQKDQYAIDFGSNEEVTFVDLNATTDQLLVGTYDKSTKRGNFYIYNCKDVRTDNSANVKPVEVHKGCAGRISSIIFKPSVQ